MTTPTDNVWRNGFRADAKGRPIYSAVEEDAAFDANTYLTASGDIRDGDGYRQIVLTGNSGGDAGTVYVSPTGSDVRSGLAPGSAKATIRAAIDALPKQDGLPVGTIELGYGVHPVTSIYRRDAGCTITNGSATILDPSITAADLGAQAWYGDLVVGGIMGSGFTICYITAVTPGVSFTVTHPATGTKANASVAINRPGFWWYPGVKIRGAGTPGHLDGLEHLGGQPQQLGAQILDSGNGVTIGIRNPIAANSVEADGYIMEDVCVTGNPGNRYGLLGWGVNRVHLPRCRFEKHGMWGVALGPPPNEEIASYYTAYCTGDSLDCTGNGTGSAAFPTGGLWLGGETWTNVFVNGRFTHNFGYNVYDSGQCNVFVNAWNNRAKVSQHRVNGQDLSGTAFYTRRAGFSVASKYLYCWAELNDQYEWVVDGEGAAPSTAGMLELEGCQMGMGGGNINGVYVPNFNGARNLDIRLKACSFGTHATGWGINNAARATLRWENCYSAEANGFIQQGAVSNSEASRKADAAFRANGVFGATESSEYVGARLGGPPLVGTWKVGNWIIARNGSVWICTVAGTPGTWVNPNAIKAGLATLVAGTVTVAYAGITADSRIRLTTQTPGGTVGTPYVSARSAGVSFTITSTSGTDTSTVFYEVVASDTPISSIMDFSPRLWVDAEQFTSLADTTAVSTAADSSLNGYDLSQATASQRPTKTTVGGKTALLFDGTNDVLGGSVGTLDTANSILFVTVYDITVAGFESVVSLAETVVEFRVSPAGKFEAIYNGGSVTEDVASTGVHVWSLRLPSGAPAQLYKDGVLHKTGTGNVATYNSAGRAFGGHVSDALSYGGPLKLGDVVWTGLLSAGDQASVEAILKTKAGI